MTSHSTADEMSSARDRAAQEIKPVLDQKMMLRRFIHASARTHRLQASILLFFAGIVMLLILQQVVTSDPAMQVARQQRGCYRLSRPVPDRADRCAQTPSSVAGTDTP